MGPQGFKQQIMGLGLVVRYRETDAERFHRGELPNSVKSRPFAPGCLKLYQLFEERFSLQDIRGSCTVRTHCKSHMQAKKCP